MREVEFVPAQWIRTVRIQNDEILVRPAQAEDVSLVWSAYKSQELSFFQYLTPITQELVKAWYSHIDYSQSIPLNAFILNKNSSSL